ncbi:MAG: tetratricopeptide repeat protein [Elusimicrobiota bacterium]|jgi:superkiller protein 3|nr:tetratricopeptide repeat protein [Elusimicrobiota bacterium]
MRVKVKEHPNNQIQITLKNDRDKNLIFSFIATGVFILVCLIVYLIEMFDYSDAKVLQKAKDYYLNERYFMAIKYYDRVLRKNPNSNPDIYRDYGMSLMKLADYDLAIKYLKKYQESEPENIDALYNLAYVIYLKAKQNSDKQGFIEAAHYLESSIMLNQKFEKSYILLGLCYRGADMYDEARAVYNKAIALKSFSQAVFYNLIGHTFSENKDYSKAIDYYKMSIATEASYVWAYLNLGDMYGILNEIQPALENYKKVIALTNDFIVPYVKIGELYMRQQKYYEVIQWLSQALKVNPEHADATYMLAQAYQNTGRQKDMVEYLRKAARLGSDEAIYKLRELGMELGK